MAIAPNGQRVGEAIDIPKTKDGLKLTLTRYRNPSRPEPGKRSVLLLHGASAASNTFLFPVQNNLVDYLLQRDCDVWTLDWRGSWRVVEQQAGHYHKFTLDDAAKYDLPLALEKIRRVVGEARPIAVFGHCMGAGALAMAIGAGTIPEKAKVNHVVLSTLGLFYEASWDGWVKAEDRILERIRGTNQACLFINSNTEMRKWPADMQGPYKRWPSVLLPKEPPSVFRRLAFMFGRPYYDKIAAEGIHDDVELKKQFGPMALKLYMQCGQNVRRGFAAEFDAMDWTPDRRGTGGSVKRLKPISSAYLNLENFHDLQVTLITGERNQLWHPESIHRMYDWLRRELSEQNCKKRIFGGYAHQDLVWGKNAWDDVYPTIATGLGA